MARRNIFELLREKDSSSFSDNIRRIRNLYSGEYDFARDINGKDYTLEEFVDEFAFNTWKARGRCIDQDDFYETIDFSSIQLGSQYSLEDFLSEIEVIYNFWYIAVKYIKEYSYAFQCLDTADELKKLMDACLSDFNHKAFYDENSEQLIIAEDKPEITAVAEIVEPQAAFEIIRYNHRTLQGDVEAKKRILLTMGAALEPQREDLKTINRALESGIFFMLNNLNLRHNNRTEGDKNYKKAVASMPAEDLEHWYDELYQMILLANLELDNKSRMHDISNLKSALSECAS